MDNTHRTTVERTRHQATTLNAIKDTMTKQVNSSGVVKTVWQDVLTLTDDDGSLYFMNLPNS